jgi:cytochrome c oxidase subunit 2
MGRKAAATALLACLALAWAASASAGTGGIGPPDPTTPSGDAASQLYWLVFAICAFVFVAVETSLVLFVVRFRRRRTVRADAEGPQIHGNTRIEVIWTIIPAVILVGIAAVVLARSPAVEATSDEGDEALRVRVEAHQFYWQYAYPSGAVSLDRLVLPVDTSVALELTSLDVNHSWWVPELTGKRDALAGRTNELRFKPTDEGTYEGKCAELCGILHAVMPTEVEIVSRAEYEAFLAEREAQNAGAAQLELGRETWESVCADCHGPDGEGDVGPPIAGNGTLANREGLDQLLRVEGQDTPAFGGYMPAVGSGWPDFQLDALIAYISSNEQLAPEGQPSGG